jgi:hypothetical protein
MPEKLARIKHTASKRIYVNVTFDLHRRIEQQAPPQAAASYARRCRHIFDETFEVSVVSATSKASSKKKSQWSPAVSSHLLPVVLRSS